MWCELPKYSFGVVSNSALGSEKLLSDLIKSTESPVIPLLDANQDEDKVGGSPISQITA